MLIFRITKETYLETYNGLGGSYQDGARWNLPGTPAMYFGLSAPIALLEMANYTVSPRMVPPDYRLGVYEVPDGAPIDRLEEVDWPINWFKYPYPDSTQKIGDQWIREANSFGLIVPSCAVSAGLGEILLVNPYHVEVRNLKLVDTRTDIFNPRAFPGV
ncbi:RES family NAD+ phosphorylase [Marinospirillum sp.]|uniref:RES family NAD+ phosphorylase n=1 Tax=Marinospirillum sp. TaxID=2183934 RepID=UPI002870945D|nr:RES family NAD+ phosphorylase [Marinospirillum sp.]MDR9468617.1 RES family NAD+ phosphorylase [Marinospirillum sp.]